MTCSTHNYLPKIRRYLETINTQMSAMWTREWDHDVGLPSYPPVAFLGAVACDPSDTIVGLEHIRPFQIPAGMLARGLGNPGNGCIQHGNWLPYLPEGPWTAAGVDPVIICTDGDVKMQRPFNKQEWAWLQGWQDGQVGIGPNEPKAGGDSMDNELVRIHPLVSRDELAQRFYPDPSVSPPIGNAGCIVATRSTWIRLWLAYLDLWMETAPLFAHIAVQQWTINLAILKYFERVELPQTFHTHGHWGYPGDPYDGWGYDGVATVNGEVILFAHKTW